MEEPVLVETTSPYFRTLRSFLCDSEKNGLFTAFALMMKTLLCHETIIRFLFGFTYKTEQTGCASQSTNDVFRVAFLASQNRTKSSREYLDLIHVE